MRVPKKFRDVVEYNDVYDCFIVRSPVKKMTGENIERIINSDFYQFYILLLEEEKDIVVDLSNLEYVDSLGIGNIVNTHGEAKIKKSIYLCNVNETIHSLIKTFQIPEVIPIVLCGYLGDCFNTLSIVRGKRSENGWETSGILRHVPERRALIVTLQLKIVSASTMSKITQSDMYRFFMGDNDALSNIDNIILDVRNVEYVDSTGIGVLINTMQKLIDKETALFVCNIQSNIRRVLYLTGIGEFLNTNIGESVESILNRFPKSR